NMPSSLAALITRCLQKDVEKRAQSMNDLKTRLEEIQEEIHREPTGAKRHLEACGVQTTRRRHVKLAFVTIGALTCAVAILMAYWVASRHGTIDSVAVLPFENASGDSSLDYLSESITESLINTLGQISALKVMARNTMEGFRTPSPDFKSIGERLRVK